MTTEQQFDYHHYTPEERKAAGCRACDVCNGASHHWLDDIDPEQPRQTHVCKHCPQRGEECSACDGMGCQSCDGEGVRPIPPDTRSRAELFDRISQLEHALRCVLHDPLHQETAATATRILEETSPQPSIKWVERTSGFAGGMKKYWGCEIDGELLAVFLSGDEWFCVSAGLGITSEVALEATDLESAKTAGLQLLRRRSERILRATGDVSDAPPQPVREWQECHCSSTDWYDRYLYLNAGYGCLTLRKFRLQNKWQLCWGSEVWNAGFHASEEKAKSHGVALLRERAQHILRDTGGITT